MRKQKKTKPLAAQTVVVCGKKRKQAPTTGCPNFGKFRLHNPQPLGVIRPVEPANIQVDLPNGKEQSKTDEA